MNFKGLERFNLHLITNLIMKHLQTLEELQIFREKFKKQDLK